MPRHGTENLIENTEELYEEILEGRGLTKITHYRTPRWPKLTAKVRSRFVRQRHTWKLGDKYYKLANQYYGDPKLWWVIAWYNSTPTEASLQPGDVISIPVELEKTLKILRG